MHKSFRMNAASAGPSSARLTASKLTASKLLSASLLSAKLLSAKLLSASLAALSLCSVFFLLRYPGEALFAIREGLSVWIEILFPSLLPFLILTGILSHVQLTVPVPDRASRLCRTLTALPPAGVYCMILGLLCGCPLGAHFASELYGAGRLTKREAMYLTTFCCQISPPFVIHYIYGYALEGKESLQQIFFMIYLCAGVSMIFFRIVLFGHPFDPALLKSYKKETPRVSSPGAVIDVSIMNGFETMAKIGGYILLFSLLSQLLHHYWPWSENSSAIVLGFTELTTGLNLLTKSSLDFSMRYILAMIMTAFGGCCILLQVRSVLHPDLPVLPYLCSRILQSVLMAGLLFFVI